MSRRRFALITPERGFTLIESIIVIVTLAIAAVGIIALNSNIFMGRESNRKLQVGSALMQECAEKILATRRENGYEHASLAQTTDNQVICAGTAVTDYVAPVVTITPGNSNTLGTSACPFNDVSDTDANDCKQVSITQDGMTPILLLLVRG